MSHAVGQPYERRDGRAKVTGTARYTADWAVPGTAHGVIVQSTIASGKAIAFDLVAARAVPGVIDVLTWQNAPRPAGHAPKGPSKLGDPRLPLQDSGVQYLGQPVAVVVAETLEAAQQGAALVAVTYRRDQAALAFDESRVDAGEVMKHDSNGRVATTGKGDVAAQLAASAHVLRRTYALPVENHHPIEPSATLAQWQDGRLTVHDATQGVASTAETLAALFGLAPGDVQVITKFVGGAFGCKGSVWTHVVIAVLAAKATARPVRVVLTRQQMATNVGYRSRTVQEVTLGCDAGGKPAGDRAPDRQPHRAAQGLPGDHRRAVQAALRRAGDLDHPAAGAPQLARADLHARAGRMPGQLRAGIGDGRARARAGRRPHRAAPDQLRRPRSPQGHPLQQQVAAPVLRGRRAALRLGSPAGDSRAARATATGWSATAWPRPRTRCTSSRRARASRCRRTAPPR